MLTKEQLNQTAEDFLTDTFTILREYIQLLFLNYFYQEKKAEGVYFKGGTCLRLILSSPRFSEAVGYAFARRRNFSRKNKSIFSQG